MFLQHETELLEDSFVLPSFQTFSKFGFSEDEFMDSEETPNNQLPVQPGRVQTSFVDSKPILVPAGSMRHDLRWRNLASSWIRRVVSSMPSVNSSCLVFIFDLVNVKPE